MSDQMLASEDGLFCMELVSQLVGYLLNCAKSATHVKMNISFLASNIRRALNVVCFLLVNSS